MYRVLAILLCTCLLFPGLVCENLLCLYCPLQMKNKFCRTVHSMCPPEELCFRAKGYYAGDLGLTASGCMTKQQCTMKHLVSYKGTNFTMTYTCCNWNFCNLAPSFSFFSSALLVAPLAATAFLLTRWMY
ncbi:protein Bouncer [Scleropages formosus]|uniref:protein Bouncer n=1 Tax=Scleropages formosus TaxID=113540 RepID=UPI000878EE09|nr:protein Bouncer-like [Scleropages formosus]